MAFTLRLTTAGKRKLADSANAGTRALKLTRLAIGDGTGPGTEAPLAIATVFACSRSLNANMARSPSLLTTIRATRRRLPRISHRPRPLWAW